MTVLEYKISLTENFVKYYCNDKSLDTIDIDDGLTFATCD